MLHYPPKILMAFGETFDENEKIYNWLVQNGYPELAALSSAIRGSEDAFNWLMANKFPQLAALDGAIDKNPKAYEWLKNHKMDFLLVFADACNERKFRDNQTFDYHKMPF